MLIKIRKVEEFKHHPLILPQYKTPGAAGMDLYAAEEVIITPGETRLIHTGWAMELPDSGDDSLMYEIQIRPRGGLSYKTGFRIPNSPGTIDNDYRGEIVIIGHNIHTNRNVVISPGDRVAQAVVCVVGRAQFQFETVHSETTRGEGRLGSTGV